MVHRALVFCALAALAACGGSGQPELGQIQQAQLSCNGTGCLGSQSYCTTATKGCSQKDPAGTVCCPCTSTTLGCGSDCLVCSTTGASSTNCTNNTTPAATSCVPVCNTGYKNLNSHGEDGCEICTDKVLGCGSDCLVCATTNASSTSCSNNTSPAATSCVPVCNSPGYKNLDGNGADGCEICTDKVLGCGSDCLPCATTNASSTSCTNNTSLAAASCVPVCNSPGYKNLDGNGANGCEICTDKVLGCGSDCLPCATTNASSTSCTNNTTAAKDSCVPACLTGYKNTDGHGENGCEICNTNTACGSDCLPCATTNASSTSCKNNTEPAATACVPVCLTGYLNQDSRGDDGCEPCTNSSFCGNNCGACASTNTSTVGCADNTHAASISCQPTCLAGYLDIDGDHQNGCETTCNTKDHCGKDCVTCANTNTSSVGCYNNTDPGILACSPVCLTGYLNYDGNAANGCEACTLAAHCGSDCQACAATNTISVGCSGNSQPATSSCQPTCQAGFLDIDGDHQNGCETTCNTAAHCGSNCAVCSTTNASSTGCADNTELAKAACRPTCLAGYKNLDGDLSDGCETCNVIGACGRDCGICQGTNAATNSCQNNTDPATLACKVGCNPGFLDLNSDASDGCETSCNTSVHCGTDCGACANTNTSSVSCVDNTHLATVSCKPTCLAGYLDTDGNHQNGCETTCNTISQCGSNCLTCSNANTASTSCAGNTLSAASSCKPVCSAGWLDLDSDGSTGCESKCTTDVHCGSDCAACSWTNASSVSCADNSHPATASCRPTCSQGWLDSDGNHQNGCETRCDQVSRCGTNCLTCSTAGATSTSCSGGNTVPASQACAPVCAAGYWNQDTDGSNGCEASCLTAGHCGSDCAICGTTNTNNVTCADNTVPAKLACRPSCTPGYADLDGDHQNGCEVTCNSISLCGTNCQACASTNASSTSCLGIAAPAAQSCTPTCKPGFADLDHDGTNGCEATCDKPSNCGSDCALCAAVNTSSVSCANNTGPSQQSCRPTCANGYLDLNSNGADGCEVTCDQTTHCGADCLVCQPVNTTAVACGGNSTPAATACQPTCKAGYWDGDADASNGCEATCTSPGHCGNDCAACGSQNTSAIACSSNTIAGDQACKPTCKPGYLDVDGSGLNGCEVTCNAVTNCGTDCRRCQNAHGTTSCAGNTALAALACKPVCDLGWVDADSDGANGCEANCNTPDHCGLQCKSCAANHTTATSCSGNTTASSASCKPTCAPGYLDQDADGVNGCEEACDKSTHCGSNCQPCATTNASATSCKGTALPAAQACEPVCEAGWISSDADGSNGCETRCNTAARCGTDCLTCRTDHTSATSCSGNDKSAAQACRPICLAGFFNSDTDGTNGCEASCDQPTLCGLECQVCVKTNATAAACADNTHPAATSCQPACKPGFASIDGDGANGCEARCDVVDRCGTDCLACPKLPHSSPICAGNVKPAAQSCSIKCDPGWADADPFADGCETSCSTPDRCGNDCTPCKNPQHSVATCSGNDTASSQACGINCESGYLDANHDATDGCEACADGYYEISKNPTVCARCDVDQHCGFSGASVCLDCTRQTGDGKVCVITRCGCNTETDCPGGTTCRGHSCVIACTLDTDCPNGQRCCGPSGKKSCVVVGPEVCDGKDNDCNGTIDDVKSADLPLCEKQQGVCKGAQTTCTDGLLKDCTDAVYAAFSSDYEATESRCDGKDNDCNGKTDEPAACHAKPDAGHPADSSVPGSGLTYELGGCGCAQTAGPMTLAGLALALAALTARRRRRG